MDNYSKIFAENLRNFRKEMGLTQEQLAEKLGYTRKGGEQIGAWCLDPTGRDLDFAR